MELKTNELYELWRYLHEHPEVSWEEVNTTTYLMNYFKQRGFHPKPFQTIPGFCVDIGSGTETVIGLRADMDALWQDVDGKMQANHSCGHDAHMAIVTGTMLQLKKYEHLLNGTIRAIFQPAEELGNGSVKVVEEGVVDDLDYLFGVHVRPKNEIAFPTCAASIQHGACVFVEGKIKGEDHHGARPHEGVNAIEIGSAILQQIQSIHTPPQIPASVTMTSFHAGSKNLNIIPGEATFGLDMRAQSNEVMTEIKNKVTKIIENLAALYEVHIEFEFLDDVPAAVINEDAKQVLLKAIERSVGKEHARKSILTSGSDDFHFYTLLRPQIKATMLALGADVEPGLHHPKMTFNKNALEHGVTILTETCLNLTKK